MAATLGGSSAAGRTEGRGLYHREKSWLWFGGLSDEISDKPDLGEMIEAARSREGGGASLGTTSVHRHAGGAWVHFSSPAFAQACITSLNGTALPNNLGVLRVRYAGENEETSGPPAVRYVKRPPPTGAPAGKGAPAGNSMSPGRCKVDADGAMGSADGNSSSSKRVKTEEGAASSSSQHRGEAAGSSSSSVPPPSRQNGGLAPPNGQQSLAPPERTASAANGSHLSREAVYAGPPLWEGGPGTNADVLRLALRCVVVAHTVLWRACLSLLLTSAARTRTHLAVGT